MENQIKNTDAGQTNQSDNPTNTQNLENQEQVNSANLSQRIEEENQMNSDYADNNETIDQSSQAEEDLSGFLERALPDSDNNRPIGNDRPLTRNLLGDNPPGSEQAAFDSGSIGDASAEQFKYDSENLIDGFRDNMDKTEEQINLQKKLKNESNSTDEFN